MSGQTHGIGWFEISTGDAPAAERFYGSLFGWTFATDEHSDQYRLVTTPAENGIGGGIVDNQGEAPNYAVFYVEVTDVEASCRRAEEAGGKVVLPARETGSGLVFAQLHDPAGNLFAIYSPPPAVTA